MEHCDETAVYHNRCSDSHAERSRELLSWRHRSGLFFDIGGHDAREPTPHSGLGQAISTALLLHSICRSLQRFCYIKMWGMRLDELVGYASGLSWGPPNATEQQAYRGVVKVPCKQLIVGSYVILARNGYHTVHKLSRAPYANASLLHVQCSLSLRFVGAPGAAKPQYLPVFKGEAASRAAPFLLDRCYCRFLTEPTYPVAARPARTVVQIRTGYADVPRDVLERLHTLLQTRRDPRDVDAQHMSRWLKLACPAMDMSTLAAARILSDSPVLAAHIGRGDGRAPPRKAFDDATLALLARGPTQSWGSEIAVRRAAFDDLVAVAQSRVAHVGYSSFVRPAVARSVCEQQVHIDPVPPGRNDQDWSKFNPDLRVGCRSAAIYHRGLFGSLLPRRWPAKSPGSNLTSLAWEYKNLWRYVKTIALLPRWHPCVADALSPAACAATWLAAVTGTSLEAARRAIE